MDGPEELKSESGGISPQQSLNGTHQQQGITPPQFNTSTSSTTVLRTSSKIPISKPDTNKMPNDTPDADKDKNGLVKKLRDHYQKSPKGLKASKLAYVFFHFHGLSSLYMVLAHMTPYLLQDYSDMTQYYCKIFFCFIFSMTQANWWCSILYKSDLPDVRDKPTLDKDDWFQRPPETLKNAETIEPKIDRFGFEWKYCKPCDRYKPPRAHHCDLCKKCILRRDHHCYFIGRCIGHYNQRYFVVMTYWGIVTSLIGLPVTLSYLQKFEDATWWGDYFLPITLLNFLYHNTVSWKFTLATFHIYGWLVFLLWGGFYFTVQISLIMEGKTLVELAKGFDMKVTSKLSERIGMVFGDYWLINFLFPAQIIFKQRHDGIHYENVKFFGKSKEAAK